MANMSLKKNEMPSQDPNVRNKNFLEVALGYTEEQALDEAARCLNCKNHPCVGGCPVNVKIPEFIRQCCITDFDGMDHFAEKGKFENAMLGYRYNEGQQLHYIFGVVGSEDIIDVPSPYSIKKISSKNWVCFPCEAGVDAIQKLWYRIYTEFMPFSSYKINENETLEISFCKNGENQLYLYMPIKEDV